ncbi:hypothetical protein R0K17_31260, partial [Planococcus sp. SIMBA_143]
LNSHLVRQEHKLFSKALLEHLWKINPRQNRPFLANNRVAKAIRLFVFRVNFYEERKGSGNFFVLEGRFTEIKNSENGK